jgi:hypothetical protein
MRSVFMVRPNQKLDVLAGMVLLVLCHAVFVSLSYAVHILSLQTWSASSNMPWGNIFILAYLPFAIGLTQLIYVIPLCLWLRRRRQLDMMKGVIIAATITVLLNGSCFLVALNMINNMHY